MINETIIEKLRSIYQSMPKVTLPEKGCGWVNQSDFQREVRKTRINFKNMGYEWFNEFLVDSGIFIFWTDYTGERPTRYIVEKTKSQRQNGERNFSSQNLTPHTPNEEEISNIKRRLRLENNQFIGQFASSNTEGRYTITDIRNTDFIKIEDKERGVKNLSISFKSPNKEFNRFAYYKFTWKLLKTSPLKFDIDLREEVTPVYPKNIVSSLYEGIMRYPAGAAKKIARSLDTLKKQLTQSGKEVFIYELLQNANDYPRRTKIGEKNVPLPVDIEFHITDNYLIFQHTGEYFNAKNIAAICDINDGEKADNTEAIGYKGIGFKTVFLDNDYVLLNTGNYSFRFDKEATDVINTTWQILPIWTEQNEIDSDIKSIFRQHPNDEFRVKFALQPRNKNILTDDSRDDNYIDLFTNVFDSERVILFIPNIKKVSIFVDGWDEPIIREKDNNNWCVSDSLVDEIPEDITEKINDVLNNPDSLRSDGYEKIPEKYMNFCKTAVKFACQKEGRKLKMVDDAMLYCYLPAKRADWGFNFLMNTDMVPNGQRDDIEDIELNHVISRIAGRQFFYWIKQLIESEEYDFDSIFSLIPDFDECKKKRVYKAFIEEFQEEFETLIKEKEFVPAIDKDGNLSFKCIDELINDMTGMTADGIMSDEDFINLMELGDYCLPIKGLRQSKSFMDFLYKHSPSNLDIKVDNIVEKCEEPDFKKWLQDIDNNIRFIKHWLRKEELDKFNNKTIFIEYKGELFTAANLYYDFDTNCSEIDFLRRFIPHLCQISKNSFDAVENWKTFTDKHFQSYSAISMITTYIISNEDAIALLNEPKNSVAFYRYLAAKEVDLKVNSTKIPYITEDGEASTDYSNYRYFYSENVHSLTQEAWLGKNIIKVLSHIYFDGVEGKNKERLIDLFARLGFNEFDKASFTTAIVVGDVTFRANVNTAIEGNYAVNKAFVKYVYDNAVQLKENSLKDYVLCCISINGNETYLCNDDVRYFNQGAYAQNSTYSENTSHAWLQADMMYALSNAYFESFDKEETKKFESFLRQQFGIKTFTDKSFFLDVVIKNKTVIYGSLVNESTMLTFLEYLKHNAERIFDDTMSFNNIKDMPLLCYDGTIIKTRETNIQYFEYNDDAKVLCEKAWCPKTYILLAQTYTDDFTQDIRQLFKITKFDINTILDIIVQHTFLKQSVTTLEHTIDFWRWIKVNQKLISSFDKFKTLPLIDKNNVFANHSSLYISDSYQQDKIESLVIRYIQTAQFVSSAYLESDANIEKTEWMKLFKKLGLKSDNKDILFSDILPTLSSFEEDSVVNMMSKHLQELKEKWNEKRHQIIQLRVRTRSGEYKPLNQVTIVNVEEESIIEPFKYIRLSNEVDSDILKTNKELLLLISAEYGKSNLITTKQMWIEAKVKDYLNKFAADENSIADIHIQFIREIAKIQSEYNIDSVLRKQIKYRTKSSEVTYMYASELTLGSIYSPACDFETNGITELPFLSDTYIFEGNKDIIKTYFKTEGMHQNMMREDLKYLTNRTFACYFWSYSFSRRLTEYETWIKEGCFNNIICIPTENSVQKAELLYAPHVAGYAVRAKVPKWEEKVSCKDIVDSIERGHAQELFQKLNFCKALSFEDCLYYLSRVDHSREEESHSRSIIINWIIAAPNHNEEHVNRYRNTPTSRWRNGKGQKKHISELYAIHPKATQERNIFHGNEFVMQTSAFPSSIDSFVKVCNILKIKHLTSSDFVAKPVGEITDETSAMITVLRPRLLILSAIENPDKFQELYEQYNTKLSQYHFIVCEKIDLGFDTIHNDVERTYNDDNHLYYVSSWKHNRTYTKFCSRLKKLIGFDVYDNVCEDVLDDSISVEACIEKYCSSLAYNEKFRAYLQSLNLSVNIELEEEEPTVIDTGYYSNTSNKNKTESTADIENNHPTTTEGQKGGIETTGTDNVSMVNVCEHKRNYPGGGVSSLHTDSYNVPTIVDPSNEQETDLEEEIQTMPSNSSHMASSASRTTCKDNDLDWNGYNDSVDKNTSYQLVGSKPYKPYKPHTLKHPKNSTREEFERLRSNGTPLELESLPPTKEEIDLLDQCNIKPEQIADTNYLAQLRLYLNLTQEQHAEPEESMEEFVRNADDVTVHKLKCNATGGRYIHTCSAARGVMYVSPSVWNKMIDDKWKICVYLDGQGKNFHYIENAEEFLKLVEKDDVVIKITGKEKTEVVKALYSGLLEDVKGTAYTLIRVAARTNMDTVFAHYIGAMAEVQDGNEDTNEYGD